ncbi:hypothetical protein GCM10007937_45060 [Mesorhizobium albiziae]|nr:hypothetical protein GCM10007937_45060 [Mesorhizobium albiziae]
MFQPALSSAVATALPMPVPAPVTTAVLLLVMADPPCASSFAFQKMRGKASVTKRAVIGDRPNLDLAWEEE